MSLANPRDLLLHRLAELLWIERTLYADVLPAVHDGAHDPGLQEALSAHRSEAREHCVRVEDALRAAGAEPAAARSQALEALKEQHESDAQSVTQPLLRDIVHCAGAARTEHLELAAYDAAIGLAAELGLSECAALLERNRREDDAALQRIEQLAARLRSELPR